ncbi:MAG TPA: hypothetical protein DCE47_19190 [Planctomycetaceae bacterium]|nr:hypothetical protein [Planctomycetaceae bacterium]
MTVRNVLVLGDSPHAAGLLEQIDLDPDSQRQPETSELPDLTILAGSEEADLAVAMSLLESDRPLIVVAGPHLAAAAVHRLALVASDVRATIRCWLPAVRELTPLENTHAPAPPLRVDRADNRPAEELLFDDLARLGRLAGRFDQVNATLGPSGTVRLESDSGPDATWTLRPTNGPAEVTLLVGDSPLELQRSERDNPETASEWLEVADGASHLKLEELVDVVETFAAIQESARRRRAIDLHHEPTSERTVFKSQMAAVGCLLLLLTLLGLVVLLVLGAALDPTSTRGGRAARVGFLLESDDFLDNTATLSDNGTDHLERIAGRIEHVRVPIVVAATGNSDLDNGRRAVVEDELDRRSVHVPEGRVITDKPPAKWAQTLLQFARIAWIVPLVVFLVLQGLILATRRASVRRASQPGQAGG